MEILREVFHFNDIVFFVGNIILITVLGYHLAKVIAKPFFDSQVAMEKYIKNTLHELNIPIATIDANVKLLESMLKDEKNLKRLQRISCSSANLQDLYNELEYLLRKENGNIEIEEFELEEFLNQVVKKFDDVKKEIQITVSCPKYYIKCDKRGFSKTIENLISNAIKFNKKDGFIHIEFNNDKLCIEDSGIGIENQNLFSIFERYYREDSGIFGHGIGLSIVKEFCDNNKIEIKISSQKDVGTKICLDLKNLISN
ncbi:MAG: Histidine kinase [Campylobacterota bacterium]|nr:Histidine kinase [Campylobacterota bacterium]MDQ1337630.1 Histidine kinase [Campylobacterota bacterium]MDQ1339740.1 Histidine kinase [Campylobacterota bacterium]